MNHNVGSWDRALRTLMGAAMLVGAFVTPFSLAVRVLVFGGMAAYILMTALSGTCLGYKMMGMSTCPLPRKREAS